MPKAWVQIPRNEKNFRMAALLANGNFGYLTTADSTAADFSSKQQYN